jgi:DNA uptake protein ComE-like DNA-binding protein
VKYRKANGDFALIEDIQYVKGIGEKTFAGIREHIAV